ncbi:MULTISPECIES: VOC family protein [unclassified Nocardioides]|uniref:VOC family protein n=1 Tax=unclassified Nocardioides TaxID=2615069 RepID=UPI0006F847A8|nr:MULTISPECIES: VOC family protein [unclassified Nocardioides]KQY64390.1 glyoxalase [Nocardioides sp. Root140]KQZ70306.1 glyoxalase [Nocardioides sp. Root151]KRF18161.1 glyoxalase [Nocardioides sp. Soil796]
MSDTHHTVNYIELGATDLAAAKAFYTSAFGWEFNDYGPDYAGIKLPGRDDEIGGLNPATTPQPGGPLVLISSDDLDATHAAVLAAGGTVTEGPYAYPGGRRFHFTDPSGNALGVYSHQ